MTRGVINNDKGCDQQCACMSPKSCLEDLCTRALENLYPPAFDASALEDPSMPALDTHAPEYLSTHEPACMCSCPARLH